MPFNQSIRLMAQFHPTSSWQLCWWGVLHALVRESVKLAVRGKQKYSIYFLLGCQITSGLLRHKPAILLACICGEVRGFISLEKWDRKQMRVAAKIHWSSPKSSPTLPPPNLPQTIHTTTSLVLALDGSIEAWSCQLFGSTDMHGSGISFTAHLWPLQQWITRAK